MEIVMETLFGNWFFELPMLEALSYIAAVLMVAAAIVGLVRYMMGTASQPAEETGYGEKPYGEWEWRKAA
jgi:hypothetical protein